MKTIHQNQTKGTTIASFLLVVLFALSVFFLMQAGFDRSFRAECIKWQSQAKEYPNFFLVEWQKAQCDDQGIVIDAKVIKQK